MSGPRLAVHLTTRASRDYRAILLGSVQRWGSAQAELYRTALDDALLRLGAFPESGAPRDEIRPGLRVLFVEQHAIYYRVTSTRVRVSRILHQRMDAGTKL